MIPLAAFEEVIDASGVAPRIEAMLPDRRARPAADGPHPAGRACAWPRPTPARPPHPGAPGADQPARGRPAAARRDRGLEARPAPADLPADRVHLRPGRGRARQGRAGRAALAGPLQAICDDLLEASHPGRVQGRQHGRWRWTGPTWSPSPGPRRAAPATAPTPRPPGATARTTCCAARTSCSTATTCPPGSWCPRRTGPPSPSSPAAPRCRRAGTTRSAPSPPC